MWNTKNITQCPCGEAYQSWLGDHILGEIISAKSLRCSPTVEILSGHHNWYLGEPAEDAQSYDGHHVHKEYGHVRSCIETCRRMVWGHKPVTMLWSKSACSKVKHSPDISPHHHLWQRVLPLSHHMCRYWRQIAHLFQKWAHWSWALVQTLAATHRTLSIYPDWFIDNRMFPPLAFSSKTESELELKPLNDSNEDINR